MSLFLVRQSLLKLLSIDIQSRRINELCVENGEQSWDYPVLNEAAAISTMLVPFAILSSDEFKNDIFYCQWKDLIRKLDNTMTWFDIYNTLWVPVLDYCTDLLQKLEHQCITLYEVDMLLKGQGAIVIAESISRLANGVHLYAVPVNFLQLAQEFASPKLHNISISSLIARAAIKSTKGCLTNWVEAVAANIFKWSNLSPVFKEAKLFASSLASFNIDHCEVLGFSEMVCLL